VVFAAADFAEQSESGGVWDLGVMEGGFLHEGVGLADAPTGESELIDEAVLERGGGLEFRGATLAEGGDFLWDGRGAEFGPAAVFEGIAAGPVFAAGRAGSGGFESVAAVGGELRFREFVGHEGFLISHECT